MKKRERREGKYQYFSSIPLFYFSTSFPVFPCRIAALFICLFPTSKLAINRDFCSNPPIWWFLRYKFHSGNTHMKRPIPGACREFLHKQHQDSPPFKANEASPIFYVHHNTIIISCVNVFFFLSWRDCEEAQTTTLNNQSIIHISCNSCLCSGLC